MSQSHVLDSLTPSNVLTPLLYFVELFLLTKLSRDNLDAELQVETELEAIRLCDGIGRGTEECRGRFHHVPTPFGICSAFNSKPIDDMVSQTKVRRLINKITLVPVA